MSGALRMVRVYLSGPISGYDMAERRSAFGVATDQLVKRGYAVVNPLEVKPDRCTASDCGPFDGHSWQCWMRHDIAELVTCDELAFLPNSHNSPGACLERDIADRLGMPSQSLAAYIESDSDTWPGQP